MRDLSPAGAVSDSVADLTDLRRFTSVTPRTNAWLYANDFAATTTGAMTLSRAEAKPFPVMSTGPLTITGFGINVTTAGATGSVVRFAVYNDDGSGYPGSLILDAGTTATTSTGLKTIILGTSLVLQPGLYWISCVAQVAVPTVTVSTASGSWSGVMPYVYNSFTTTAGGATSGAQSYAQGSITGAYPNPYPTAFPQLPGNCPRMLFRT